MLRFESSQISWRRLTTRDTTLRGIDIPAGTQISLNFASANRQSDLFEDPDQFDIHRPNASQHISFGEGMQYCLGANLAKFEAVLVLEALTERLPSLHMVQGQPIWSSPNIIFRGPEQFIVDWNPADGHECVSSRWALKLGSYFVAVGVASDRCSFEWASRPVEALR